MTTKTTCQSFFEAKYRGDSDPWKFGSSAYEQRRYETQLRALQPNRYQHVFEPGCSVGVFTALLANICDQVFAIDVSPTAVCQARTRCASFPHVMIECGQLPDALPAGLFDLIVFCEIGYYFTSTQLQDLARQLISRLAPGGTFFAAHWLGTSEDHLLHGDEVHAVLEKIPDLTLTLSERHAGFRMQRFQKSGAAPCITLLS